MDDRVLIPYTCEWVQIKVKPEPEADPASGMLSSSPPPHYSHEIK